MLAGDGEVLMDYHATARSFREIQAKAIASLHALDTIVWTVDPRKDTLRSLASYLAGFVEEYASIVGLNCQIEIQHGLPNLALGPDVRHNLFLAVKEAVHNAARHAAPAMIGFRVAVRGMQLVITIADDGRGFPKKGAPDAGHGLENLRERLVSVHGFCDVRARPKGGTLVQFCLLLPVA